MVRFGVSMSTALIFISQLFLTSCGTSPSGTVTDRDDWSKRLEDSVTAAKNKLKQFDSMARSAGIPTEKEALESYIDTIFNDPARKAEAADVYMAYKRRLTPTDLAVLETLEEFVGTGDRERFNSLRQSLQNKDMPTFDPRIIRYLESRMKQ